MTQGSILDGIISRRDSAESQMVNTLFDFSNDGRLKMTTEIQPDLIFPLTCLGVISSRYKSKVLPAFSKELFLLLVSKDRKGRLELVEALISSRRLASDTRSDE